MKVTITLSDEMINIVQQHMDKHDLNAIGITNTLRIILNKFARIEGYDVKEASVSPRKPRRGYEKIPVVNRKAGKVIRVTQDQLIKDSY